MKTISIMRFQTFFLVVYSLLPTSYAKAKTPGVTKTTENSRNCKPAPSSTCELCPGGAHSGRPDCETTGKHQLHLCQTSYLDDDDVSDPDEVFRSCKRTRWDEDYLMMRLQGLCMLLAFLSLRSVKREKVSTETLFDQRKRIAQIGNANVQNVQKKSQEMVPLVKDTGGLENFGDEETGDTGNRDFNVLSQGTETL